MNSVLNRPAALILVALGSTLVACGGKDAAIESAAAEATATRLTESVNADGQVEQQIDINGDGQPDVYNFFQSRTDGPRLLKRKDVDLNWDGHVDVRTWFNPDGSIEKEEMDGDFDHTVDWVDHYQGGKRVLSEVDTDYNGAFDLFKIYEGGKVRRKERDSNGDGRVDYWEYLDEKGVVQKVGKDVDGDGVMDIRED